jgi:hypothetical protein
MYFGVKWLGVSKVYLESYLTTCMQRANKKTRIGQRDWAGKVKRRKVIAMRA